MASLITKYSLLSFPIASFGLGVWQIKRLEWKKGLLAELNKKTSEEPMDILSIDSLEDLNQYEYRKIMARGRFDQNQDHQLILKPRQLVVNNEAIYRGRTAHQSNIGVNIVTPFQVDGTNLRILVNRGWLALKGSDSIQDSSAQSGMGDKDEIIDLVGILRKSDHRPRYGLKNDETKNEWQIRDVEAMSKVLKTAPIFIDADERLSPGKGPIGGQSQLNIRNEHLNYAITWFFLSAFSYIMWYSKYGRHYKGLLSMLTRRRSSIDR